MYICENEFGRPDPKTPDYSLAEVDYYGWIPRQFQSEMPNHRLSLRKNLITGEYEVYRQYKDSTIKQVAYTGDLKGAILFACAEWRRYHGEGKEDDKICEHQQPKKALFCKPKQMNNRVHLIVQSIKGLSEEEYSELMAAVVKWRAGKQK